MTPSPKAPKVSEQFQGGCISENFVRKRAFSQIDRKQWGTKRDSDRFYVNTVLQDQTALAVLILSDQLNVQFYYYLSDRIFYKRHKIDFFRSLRFLEFTH